MSNTAKEAEPFNVEGSNRSLLDRCTPHIVAHLFIGLLAIGARYNGHRVNGRGPLNRDSNFGLSPKYLPKVERVVSGEKKAFPATLNYTFCERAPKACSIEEVADSIITSRPDLLNLKPEELRMLSHSFWNYRPDKNLMGQDRLEVVPAFDQVEGFRRAQDQLQHARRVASSDIVRIAQVVQKVERHDLMIDSAVYTQCKKEFERVEDVWLGYRPGAHFPLEGGESSRMQRLVNEMNKGSDTEFVLEDVRPDIGHKIVYRKDEVKSIIEKLAVTRPHLRNYFADWQPGSLAKIFRKLEKIDHLIVLQKLSGYSDRQAEISAQIFLQAVTPLNIMHLTPYMLESYYQDVGRVLELMSSVSEYLSSQTIQVRGVAVGFDKLIGVGPYPYLSSQLFDEENAVHRLFWPTIKAAMEKVNDRELGLDLDNILAPLVELSKQRLTYSSTFVDGSATISSSLTVPKSDIKSEKIGDIDRSQYEFLLNKFCYFSECFRAEFSKDKINELLRNPLRDALS